MKHDLVVVVPGIMGTSLSRDGEDAWNTSLAMLRDALTSRAGVAERLRLQDGIGDGEPEPRYALEVGEPIRTLRQLPGWGRHGGHAHLARHLGIDRERLVTFPYDWRLSNRNSAEKLRQFVDEHLDRWRTTADPRRYPEARDAKVILLCRSMGGLVARYYLEVLGGRRETRAVVTLGTPYRGSLKAMRMLTGHASGAMRPWRSLIREVCSTYPSIGQLLPTYEVVEHSAFGRIPLQAVAPVEGIPAAMLDDAARFAWQIERAVEENERKGVPSYDLLVVGGDKHPTTYGVRHGADESLEYLHRVSGSPWGAADWWGDSTVSRHSAQPLMDDENTRTQWCSFRHASMFDAARVREQMRNVCDGRPLLQDLADDYETGIDLPDTVMAGEEFEVVAVRADAAMRLVVRQVTEDGRVLAETPMKPCGDGEFRVALRLEPGLWRLQVASGSCDYECSDTVLAL
ncbi:esterase/lipase family protein [Streptomyces hyderabadensis]|uniref:Lecithin:cholesterol acyltransferase n=1 Tax=Streptomyces hyderabadensis TaxID=598549 RepID=A0ABP9IDB2_9ACTN|nr:hypothetical protein [Streptomyces hyderabadensis]